tara:strand:- start:134 stop:349 length:216 start_codon:yes stop_codon:yes gene_type:complete
MKVKTNSYYKYSPVGLDCLDPRTNLMPGDIVQVKNIPGCPPANTMGHCHVYYKGKFAGLVLCNSLVKTKEL